MMYMSNVMVSPLCVYICIYHGNLIRNIHKVCYIKALKEEHSGLSPEHTLGATLIIWTTYKMYI